MNKKLLAVGVVGVVGWYAYRNFMLTDNDLYSEAEGLEGGFIKTSGSIKEVIGMQSTPNSSMNFSTLYLDAIKRAESFEPKPYYASKYEETIDQLTIGYGHVIVKGDSLNASSVLTLKEGLALLVMDIEAKAKYARMVKVPLTQGQFDAVTDFNFNCGQGHFMGLSNLTKKYGINPLKAFNDLGVSAGVAEMVKYYSLLGNRPDAKGLFRRSQFQQGMAGRGVYEF